MATTERVRLWCRSHHLRGYARLPSRTRFEMRCLLCICPAGSTDAPHEFTSTTMAGGTGPAIPGGSSPGPVSRPDTNPFDYGNSIRPSCQ